MPIKEKSCFLSRRWRPNDWPFWVLVGFEFALTVALLAFVGIAAPNLYRTKLQLEGSLHDWNSSPSAEMYAAANDRPFKKPLIWSQFLTNYNLVIVVLSMFLMLVKSILYILHVFPPIISVVLHAILTILYTLSTTFQLGSDTSDPKRPQNGPPWYITKPCSAATHDFNMGYCQQAKATFGCTATLLGMFVIYLGFSIFSCFPSAQQMEDYREKKRAEREKYGFLEDQSDDGNADQEGSEQTAIPLSSGALNPMTPRTLAFNTLGGTRDLPLRIQTSKNSLNPVSTTEMTKSQKATKRDSKSSFLGFGLRSPGLPRTPGNQSRFAEVPLTPDNGAANTNSSTEPTNNPMYFPPPPKQSTKK